MLYLFLGDGGSSVDVDEHATIPRKVFYQMEQMVKLLVGQYDDGMLHKCLGFEWMKNLVGAGKRLHLRREEVGSPAHGAGIDAASLHVEEVGASWV